MTAMPSLQAKLNQPATTMPAFQTKLDKLKEMWAAGDYRKALKLAASWPQLGLHKAQITQGWAAAANPNLYRQMQKDPDALYATGLAAVAERYKLTPATNTAL